MIQLLIYDLNGRLVKTLLHANKNSGYHEILFNAEGISSGVYVYRLITEDHILQKKMLLIR